MYHYCYWLRKGLHPSHWDLCNSLSLCFCSRPCYLKNIFHILSHSFSKYKSDHVITLHKELQRLSIAFMVESKLLHWLTWVTSLVQPHHFCLRITYLGHVSACSVAQSCPTLCDPMDCNPPDSSVRGIFHAKILEWVSISFSRGFSQPGDQTCVSCIFCIGRRILYHWATWEAHPSHDGLLKFLEIVIFFILSYVCI